MQWGAHLMFSHCWVIADRPVIALLLPLHRHILSSVDVLIDFLLITGQACLDEVHSSLLTGAVGMLSVGTV